MGFLFYFLTAFSDKPTHFFGPQISNEASSKVYFLDVGQGDFSFIVSGGKCWFIDAGGSRALSFQQQQFIVNLCSTENKVIITHFDRDHIFNLAGLLRRIPVSSVYLPHVRPKARLAARALNEILKKKIPTVLAYSGMTLSFDGINAKFLWPPKNEALTLKQENARSVVTWFQVGKTRLLFLGDAPKRVESLIISERVHILKVGHHGSHTSSSAKFLSRVNPQTCVISYGEKNSYGHPHRSAIERLIRQPCAIVATAKFSAIEINL